LIIYICPRELIAKPVTGNLPIKMFVKKNLFIFRKFVLTIVFLLIVSLMISCSRSSEITSIAANQSNESNKKSMNEPTPPNIKNNNEIEPIDLSKVPTVTYCELIKNAADYDRKIVRVRGIYFNGFERMFFYDEHCVKNEPPQAPKNIPAETWIEWDGDYSRKDDSEEAKTYRAVKSGERKDATVVGRFYAARGINSTGSGKHQLRIMRVEKILNIED
jgi:hypothetical protein